MKLLFKQKMFSWLDSYDVFDEAGNTIFSVGGKLSWGHCLVISDGMGRHAGTVKEEVMRLLPRFALFDAEDHLMGEIKKEFTFFKPVFTLNCNDWQVEGDLFEWDYRVTDGRGALVMEATKQPFNWTDTYVVDVIQPENTLLSLMIVLAIDAAKCSDSN